MRRSNAHFNVAPRYSPGSPAMVSEQTALTVASQEKESYEVALSGIYGEDFKKIAEQKGLDGIVELRVERRDGWDVEDMITGKKCRRETITAKKLQRGDRILQLVSGESAERWNKDLFPVTAYKVYEAEKNVVVCWDQMVGNLRFVLNKNDRVRIERPIVEEY